MMTLAAGVALVWMTAAAGPQTSVRYALIVGNNHGRAPAGLVLPELSRAERDARAVREALVSLGNFDPSPARTVLVLGGSRAEILAAAQQLAAVHRRDRELLGTSARTLFAFFYTGHGVRGELLTGREPLRSRDLAEIFSSIGATFSLGVFDACFSGDLDMDSIMEKGMEPTFGFNVFDALPQEVLSSEGSMWFVSSQPGQVSYEDEQLGGVFLHFFLEGMRLGRRDGLGITVEDVWEHARRHTVSYTERTVRPQTPQKLIRRLTSTGPLYLSFPSPRSATLVLTEAVAGQFVVQYEDGQLTELIEKKAGAPLRVPMYPLPAVLERRRGQQSERQLLSLKEGETIWVHEENGWHADRRLGHRESPLRAKGDRLYGLVLTRHERALGGSLHLAWVLDVGHSSAREPQHGISAGLRLDYGRFFGRFDLAYSPSGHRFATWGYSSHRARSTLEGGVAFDLWRLRLGPSAAVGYGYRFLDFDDTTHRDLHGLILRAGGTAMISIPAFSPAEPLFVSLRLAAELRLAPPDAPPDAPLVWTPAFHLSLGIAAALF